jgi:hypothetical protein
MPKRVQVPKNMGPKTGIIDNVPGTPMGSNRKLGTARGSTGLGKNRGSPAKGAPRKMY